MEQILSILLRFGVGRENTEVPSEALVKVCN
jgi:hypothetical protein